jgi:hypothetical protein
VHVLPTSLFQEYDKVVNKESAGKLASCFQNKSFGLMKPVVIQSDSEDEAQGGPRKGAQEAKRQANLDKHRRAYKGAHLIMEMMPDASRRSFTEWIQGEIMEGNIQVGVSQYKVADGSMPRRAGEPLLYSTHVTGKWPNAVGQAVWDLDFTASFLALYILCHVACAVKVVLSRLIRRVYLNIRYTSAPLNLH